MPRPRMTTRPRRRPLRAPPLRDAPPDGGDARLTHLIIRNTADQVHAVGLRPPWFGDLYHRILTIGWLSFLGLGTAVYIAANFVFALLYLMQPGSIANAHPGMFTDAFFFSVQTMATIGYGVMAPATLYANLLMTIETAVGLMFIALATGLVFARFSRPTARILFSRVAVIGPYNGTPALMFRVANQRQNQILAAQVTATLVRDERTEEGDLRRRLFDLKLVRDRTPVFALTFTVVHQIADESPLHGATPASLAAQNVEIVVTTSGIDETLVQPVHARTSYLPDEILCDRRFVDIIGWTEDGRRAIDYRRFHDTMELPPPDDPPGRAGKRR